MRTIEMGMPWFPFYCRTLEDTTAILGLDYGPLGEIVYIDLLCRIHATSYFLKEDFKQLSIKIAKRIGTRWARPEKVSEIILYCFDIGLFHKAFMSDSVITSKAIQANWVRAKKRSKAIITEYSLLSIEQITDLQKEEKVEISASESEINDTTKPNNDTTKPNNVTRIQQEESREEDPPRPNIILKPEIELDHTAQLNNSISVATIKTVEDFKAAFPKKAIGNLEKVADEIKTIDWPLFTEKYLESEFCQNTWSLETIIRKHEKLINNDYKTNNKKPAQTTFSKPKIESRNYTSEQMDSFTDKIENVAM